jgi:hypothetical protein
MSVSIAGQGDDLARFDRSDFTREPWKIMFISGMGFFTDAYDRFVIGVAMHLIKAEWHSSALANRAIASEELRDAPAMAFAAA